MLHPTMSINDIVTSLDDGIDQILLKCARIIS